MKVFSFLIIFVLSCDNDATNINPKRVDDLIKSSIFIDVDDIYNPAMASYKNLKDRIFISTIENVFMGDSIRNRSYIDANKYIGGDLNYIDFGTHFTLGDVIITRDRVPNEPEYTFKHYYDSNTFKASYNPVFNFIEKPYLKNTEVDGTSSAKGYLPSKLRLNSDKRIKFVNIEAGQLMDTESDLIILFNRSVKKGNTAIGFIYYDINAKIKFLNLLVNDSGNIIKVDQNYIKEFYQNVGEDHFKCFIWVAETEQLSTQYKTQNNVTLEEQQTAILINFIQTIEVQF